MNEISFEQAHQLAIALKQIGQDQQFHDNEAIPKELRERVWSFIQGDLAEPTNSLPGSSFEEWFNDCDIDSNWIRYIDLLHRKKWSDLAIQNIESTTRKTLNFLFDPKSRNASKKYGLVVGHVQSGKTANFTGLLARAADSGYNLFIVLAGLHNNLRFQTQIRLMRELMGKDIEPNGYHVKPPQNYDWNMMTSKEDDFIGLPDFGSITGINSRSIAVVKKNKAPLTKLRNLLSEIPKDKREKINLLIIDDEADHATINTMVPRPTSEKEIQQLEEWYEDFEDDSYDEDEILDATTINTRLREIICLFDRSSYVGYTATPFANVLIDPVEEHKELGMTLYPRDFILSLPKPNLYMGLDEFFPDLTEMDYTNARQVYPIDNLEAEIFRDLEDEQNIEEEEQDNIYTSIDDIINSNLADAVIDYILIGGAKYSRGMVNFHHSMLVHIKHTDRNQSPITRKLKSLVRYFNMTLANIYSNEHQLLKNRFMKRWEEEFYSHPDTQENWEEIWPQIQTFISKGYEVMKINSYSQHNLNFESRSNGLRVIAVGGNRLSRGLTIEGLSCSYFVRETKMYDTLTQMGRWFGFRPNYRDLVRIHATPNLIEWFTWLTGVERELREDISRYSESGLKPSELAVRILKHRKMLPTSKSKMRSARIFRGGLDESCPRNKKFCYDDPDVLRKNLAITATFLDSLGEKSRLDFDQSLLWRNVDPDIILDYLRAMTFYGKDNSFNEIDIKNHINSRLEVDELNNWSVSLIHNSKSEKKEKPFEEYGYSHSFGLTTRSRIFGQESIGELMQSMHFAIDLPGEREIYRENNAFSYNKMYKNRDANNPLLVIYILDKNSTISKQSRQPRENLFKIGQEKVHIVALAIAFPKSNMSEYDRERQTDYFALRGIPNVPENDAE